MEKWSNPVCYKLKKLSAYFGISVDALLGNENRTKGECFESELDKEIKANLNYLSKKDKELVLDLIRTTTERDK